MIRKALFVGFLLTFAVFHAAVPAAADKCSVGYDSIYTFGTAIGGGYRSRTVRDVIENTTGTDPTGQRIAGRGIAVSEAISTPDYQQCAFTGVCTGLTGCVGVGDETQKQWFGFTGNYDLGIGGNDVVGGTWADNSANPCGENDFQSSGGTAMGSITTFTSTPVSYTIGVNDVDGPRYNQTSQVVPDPGELDGTVDTVVSTLNVAPVTALWGANDDSGDDSGKIFNDGTINAPIVGTGAIDPTLDDTELADLDNGVVTSNLNNIEVSVGPLFFVNTGSDFNEVPIIGDLSADPGAGTTTVTTCTNDNTVSPFSDAYDCSTPVITTPSGGTGGSLLTCVNNIGGTGPWTSGGADGFRALVFYEPTIVCEDIVDTATGGSGCNGVLYGINTAGTMTWS